MLEKGSEGRGREKEKNVKKEKRRQELMVGGKAMYYNYRLETKVTEAEKEKGEKVERFGVDYELEIQEIAKNRAKVKVIDASGTDRYPRDAKNKPALIAFLDGQWVETRNLVMIETKQVYRNKRLNHLLDDD